MVVLATEARKVIVEDAISLDRAVRFRENAGGRSGTNRRSYRDISMTARKNLPAWSMCVWRSIECRRCEGKMKRAIGTVVGRRPSPAKRCKHRVYCKCDRAIS